MIPIDVFLEVYAVRWWTCVCLVHIYSCDIVSPIAVNDCQVVTKRSITIEYVMYTLKLIIDMWNGFGNVTHTRECTPYNATKRIQFQCGKTTKKYSKFTERSIDIAISIRLCKQIISNCETICIYFDWCIDICSGRHTTKCRRDSIFPRFNLLRSRTARRNHLNQLFD